MTLIINASNTGSFYSRTSWRLFVISLLLLLLLLLQPSTSSSSAAAATTPSTLLTSTLTSTRILQSSASSYQSVPIPPFKFHIMLHYDDKEEEEAQTGLDYVDFTSRVQGATKTHLSNFFLHHVQEQSLYPNQNEHENFMFVSIQLNSTLRHNHPMQTSPTTILYDLDVFFHGYVTIMNNNYNELEDNIALLRGLLKQAFVVDEYWNLMHYFAADPTLTHVDYLNVTVTLEEDDANNSNSSSTNTGALATICIFSLLMVFVVSALFYAAFRQRFGTCNECCCGQSKGSATSTEHFDDDNDDDSYYNDIVERYHDEHLEKNQSSSSHQLKKKKKRKNKMNSTHPINNCASDICSLDSIQEEGGDDEEGMTNIPLGVSPLV